MPITVQAKKKLRHDRKRTIVNAKQRKNVRDVVKDVRAKPNAKALSLAFQALDKAAKTNSIHPNKAARLKSRLAKLLAK
jgi:small subunit ribosomal protein S20